MSLNALTNPKSRARSVLHKSDVLADEGYASRSSSDGSAEQKLTKNGFEPGLLDREGDPHPVRADIVRHTEEHKDWVSFRFTDCPEELDDSYWMIGQPLCPDKAISCYEVEGAARGVFDATELCLEGEGRHAVAKIYMQTHGEPGDVPRAILQEVKALTKLQEVSPELVDQAPKLIELKVNEQEHWSLVPGGWIIIIVMEKCPGRRLSLREFYHMPKGEREEIRKSFLEAMRQLHAAGVVPLDLGMRNLLWDDVSRKCYIIDLESAMVSEHPIKNYLWPSECMEEYDLVGWNWIDGHLWRYGMEENEYPGPTSKSLRIVG